MLVPCEKGTFSQTLRVLFARQCPRKAKTLVSNQSASIPLWGPFTEYSCGLKGSWTGWLRGTCQQHKGDKIPSQPRMFLLMASASTLEGLTLMWFYITSYV